MLSRFLACSLALMLSGCATADLREAVPEALSSVAQPTGLDRVRIWGDQGGQNLANILLAEQAAVRLRGRKGQGHHKAHQDLLALSGGADDGAFGAGLLTGWTERGDRPEFQLVTGVSAGALIAPFAFLGPAYDRQLTEIYTAYSSEDIYQVRLLPGLLGGTALADNAPLAALITRYVDRRLMRRLAEERAKGRVLIIGTTNIDVQRPVYWDIGRIAQSGNRNSLQLIRNILLASAALPGLFPPVRIKVEADGKVYEELHVDGGPTRQVFIGPKDLSFKAFDKAVGQSTTRTLWVVRNAKITPEYAAVKESTLAISQRALETLTKYQSIGDLSRMHTFAQREGLAYRLASIPADFTAPRPQPFDRAYMQALFARGLAFGKSGTQWATQPP